MDPPYSLAQRIALVISCLTECFASRRFRSLISSSGIDVDKEYQERVISSDGISMIFFASQFSR